MITIGISIGMFLRDNYILSVIRRIQVRYEGIDCKSKRRAQEVEGKHLCPEASCVRKHPSVLKALFTNATTPQKLSPNAILTSMPRHMQW